MSKDNKAKILAVLRGSSKDLTIGDVARLGKISRATASKYLGVLEAEGRAEISRRIGRAVLYRARR